MEIVRYRPPDVLRWFQIGASGRRQAAARQGRSVVRREGERTIGKDIRQVAGAILEIGKGAFADIVHRLAEGTEYNLGEESFEIVSGGRSRTLAYDEIKHISARNGDRFVLQLDQGCVTIAPAAYLVAGRAKVPLGWLRNGLEAPYTTLVDEIAARCGVEVIHP